MRVLVTLLALVALSCTAVAVSVSDVSGTWDLEMKWSSDATSTGVCTFTQTGEKLTGTCGQPDKFPVTGEVEGNRLSWEVEVEQNGNKARMEFAGELDQHRTTVTGSCGIVGGQGGTFTMKRQQ